MPRIWSLVATQDLIDIWEFVMNESSASRADAVLKNIDHACITLSDWSKIGRARDDVRKGLRSMRVERHVVFYRITKTALEIVRVLDDRRDVDALFENEA